MLYGFFVASFVAFDGDVCCDLAADFLQLAEKQKASYPLLTGHNFLGGCLVLIGDIAEGIAHFDQGIPLYDPAKHRPLATRFGEDQRTVASLYLSSLAHAYAELGQFDHAWHRHGEAMMVINTAKERWCEAEVNRIAGEITLRSPERDAAKAEGYFERALAVARKQQAKSWELRAAMSMARLWRDQGKSQQARELLAPVHGWFTEGFDTLDLKEAKALLEKLAS